MLLGLLLVSNADGEYVAADAPVVQSALRADGSSQGDARPHLIPYHNYLTCTTAADERSKHTHIDNALRE